MKTMLSLTALFATALVLSAGGSYIPPKAKITVRVMAEDGQPVQGAQATFTFLNPATGKGVPVIGLTDEKGEFSGEGFSDPKVGGQIEMTDCYPSGFPSKPFRDLEDNRWTPWNPTFTTTLRKIVQPVPLCVKAAWIEIPEEEGPSGFDLEQGDWVGPHGKGTKSDLVFELVRRYAGRTNFEVIVTMRFANPADGIQEAIMPESGRFSFFKWQRAAPDEGYSTSLTSRFAHSPGGTYEKTATSEQNFFFRVRTQTNLDGTVLTANYGKIAGGLLLAPSNSKTCKVMLSYYFNPVPNDRNLEWDLKKNLVEGVSFGETPRSP